MPAVSVSFVPEVWAELEREALQLSTVREFERLRPATVADVVHLAVEYVLDMKAEARFSAPIGGRSCE